MMVMVMVMHRHATGGVVEHNTSGSGWTPAAAAPPSPPPPPSSPSSPPKAPEA